MRIEDDCKVKSYKRSKFYDYYLRVGFYEQTSGENSIALRCDQFKNEKPSIF